MKLIAAACTLAAMVAQFADAACPNQCSGHGTCDETDRCVCNKAPGTKGGYRDAWMGADCSQRVCPFGDSHDVVSDTTQELLPVNSQWSSAPSTVGFIPSRAASQHRLVAFLNNGFLLNRDLGVDVRVVSVDTGSQKARFQWKLSTQRTFNAEVEMELAGGKYSSRARAYHVQGDFNEDGVTEATGLYLYWSATNTDFNSPVSSPSTQTIWDGDRYYLNITANEGKFFTLTDQNSVHPVVECSGRGACDRTRGECKCFPGFGGDACQRTVCPNDCSGHGTCQNLKYFVEEGTNGALTYTGVDGTQQMGCKCDVGYRGYDCSQIECPSGSDPLGGDGGAEGQDCSGRGMCDYHTGTCACFKGFAGERCETQTTFV